MPDDVKMIPSMLDRVREFHRKHGFDVDLKISDPNPDKEVDQYTSFILGYMGAAIGHMAVQLEDILKQRYDPRLMRAQLLIEELGETVSGLSEGEPILTLDGLADTLYVTLGAAVTFGWDLEEAFTRVHDSNMTKAKRGTPEAESSDPRLRNKGESYVCPNLKDLV